MVSTKLQPRISSKAYTQAEAALLPSSIFLQRVPGGGRVLNPTPPQLGSVVGVVSTYKFAQFLIMSQKVEFQNKTRFSYNNVCATYRTEVMAAVKSSLAATRRPTTVVTDISQITKRDVNYGTGT